MVGSFHYTADGCWSTDWYDAEGYNTPGVQSKMSVSVRNSGGRTSEFIWIIVESTDWMATHPTDTYTNWPELVPWHYAGDSEMVLPGPQVLAGKTRTLGWDTVFESPGDVHYTVKLVEGPDPKTDPGAAVLMDATPFATWDVWTSSRVCY